MIKNSDWRIQPVTLKKMRDDYYALDTHERGIILGVVRGEGQNMYCETSNLEPSRNH